ncbi:hypothetical protein C1X95_30720, partial [Pseudomonas sp. FW306-2-11AD]
MRSTPSRPEQLSEHHLAGYVRSVSGALFWCAEISGAPILPVRLAPIEATVAVVVATQHLGIGLVEDDAQEAVMDLGRGVQATLD